MQDKFWYIEKFNVNFHEIFFLNEYFIHFIKYDLWSQFFWHWTNILIFLFSYYRGSLKVSKQQLIFGVQYLTIQTFNRFQIWYAYRLCQGLLNKSRIAWNRLLDVMILCSKNRSLFGDFWRPSVEEIWPKLKNNFGHMYTLYKQML